MRGASGVGRRASGTALLLWPLLLAAGCGDSSTEPEAGGVRTGEYLLESIGGDPLPAVARADATDTTTIVFASLTLDVNSEYSLHSIFFTSTLGDRDTTDIRSGYTYGQSGDTIWIEYPGDFIPISEPDTLVYDDGTLRGTFDDRLYLFRHRATDD